MDGHQELEQTERTGTSEQSKYELNDTYCARAKMVRYVGIVWEV